jgi:hypothetical protein
MRLREGGCAGPQPAFELDVQIRGYLEIHHLFARGHPSLIEKWSLIIWRQPPNMTCQYFLCTNVTPFGPTKVRYVHTRVYPQSVEITRDISQSSYLSG